MISIFIIRKRKQLDHTSDVDVYETQKTNTSLNPIGSVIKEDDPFAEDFNGDDNPLNQGIMI